MTVWVRMPEEKDEKKKRSPRSIPIPLYRTTPRSSVGVESAVFWRRALKGIDILIYTSMFWSAMNANQSERKGRWRKFDLIKSAFSKKSFKTRKRVKNKYTLSQWRGQKEDIDIMTPTHPSHGMTKFTIKSLLEINHAFSITLTSLHPFTPSKNIAKPVTNLA